MFTNTEFYPTPKELTDKMLSDIDFRKLKSVLEPSAGKGDIAKAVIETYKEINTSRYDRSIKKPDLDVIEIDPTLRHILKGENLRVVHDDFLSFHTYKKYDLIILNPPFSSGEKHLLKAIDVQKNGGDVVCLLNAETLRNPYSNTRKELIQKLEEYDAEVEFLENSFANAERKTMVDVALIKMKIPSPETKSVLLESLKSEETFNYGDENWSNDLVASEFLARIVQQYNFEVQAGIKIIKEFNAMSPYILSSFKDNVENKLLNLTVGSNAEIKTQSDMINSFVKSVRNKYWQALFDSKQFSELFTNKLRTEYYEKISELVDYDFSLFNIYQIQEDLSKSLLESVEDTIVDLFDEFSHKHYYHTESSKNIHYYNGWKTNSSWKINKKVIIPLSAYSSYWGYDCADYRVVNKLSDIEKVLNYLDRGLTDHAQLQETLAHSKAMGRTKKIQLKFFMVTFYKKGTCHIEFTNHDLLAKFNLYGSRKKGWLPPSYGKKEYEEMTSEEQSIIDEFQGKNEYGRVLKEKEYFLSDQMQILDSKPNQLFIS